MKVILPNSGVLGQLIEIEDEKKRPKLVYGHQYERVWRVEAMGKTICFLGTDCRLQGLTTKERGQWILWTLAGHMWTGFGWKRQEAIDRGLASDARYISG